MFEGWLTLAAWAQATERVRIGLMVGANTFREPALTAKMATTLDHISNGRAILGIGARLVRDRAQRVRARVRRRVPGAAALARRGAADHARHAPRRASRRRPARATRAKAVRNDPPPIQARLPLLIGGGGEQVTLKLVAQYGDANNVGGGHRERPAQGGDPRPALRDGRAGPGRDRADDRHRDGRSSATRAPRRSGSIAAIFERNGKAPSLGRTSRSARPRTSPRRLAPYLEIGYRHLIAGFPAPLRRGIDDPPRDRGPPDARARLTKSAEGLDSGRRGRAAKECPDGGPRGLVRGSARHCSSPNSQHDQLLLRSSSRSGPSPPGSQPSSRPTCPCGSRWRSRSSWPSPGSSSATDPGPQPCNGAAPDRSVQACTADSSVSAPSPSTPSGTSCIRATSGWPARPGWPSPAITRRSLRAPPSSSRAVRGTTLVVRPAGGLPSTALRSMMDSGTVALIVAFVVRDPVRSLFAFYLLRTTVNLVQQGLVGVVDAPRRVPRHP